MRSFRLVGLLMLISMGSASATLATQKAVAAAGAWVKLPAEGDSTAAFVTIENPTMYDVYLVSARSDVAGAITFRQGTAGATKEVKELVVPAFGTLEMTPDSAHLRLSALKKPLAEKDSVAIDITTDGNVVIEVKAVVLRGGGLLELVRLDGKDSEID